MQYTSHYHSPLGDILLAADDTGLTGSWFEGQKYYALNLDKEHEEKEVSVLETARQWLDIYFSGKDPDFSIPQAMRSSILDWENRSLRQRRIATQLDFF